ncbi:MAG: uroporphyrinogen decarboxylase family protein [bacterium]
MNVIERTYSAFTRTGLPDRVPVHAWLGLSFIRTLEPREYSMVQLFERWIDDPVGTLVRYQEELGLDPLITTYSKHIGEIEVWPRMLFSYDDRATAQWNEEIREVERTAVSRTVEHRIETPSGSGSYTHRTEGYNNWLLEHLIKDENDLALLQHRPDPHALNLQRFKSMIASVGDRAWWLHHAPGPWDEAVELRGFANLATDVRERPAFVHRLMRLVTDRLVKLYRKLGETDIQAISMNETWVGVGVSPEVYREFIYPYDQECTAAAHDAGFLVSYHNCGTGAAILEEMVETGADALETISVEGSVGDFDLADVKKRVGHRVCLFGGFNERVLLSEDPQQVRDEVKRCIDAAAAGGGYILRPGGQIFHADRRNIEIMCETVREYGRY